MKLKDLGGPLIGAAASLIGGSMSQGSQKKALQAQQLENERDRAFQREFAQHGVRWRVEDAEAAGLHPLFALGANTASASGGAPLPVMADAMGPAVSEAGQAVGRAVAAQETEEQRALRAAQLRLINAQADAASAEAMRSRSEVALRVGQTGPSFPSISGDGDSLVKINPVDPLGQYRGLDSVPLAWDTAKFEADPMTSRSSAFPGQTAGRGHASFREFEMPNGDLLYLPATQGGGIPEEIDITLVPEIIGANIQRYGFNQAVFGALHRWLGRKYSEGMYTPGSDAWRERFPEYADPEFRRYNSGRYRRPSLGGE